MTPTYKRVTINGRAFWKFSDGKLLPVVSGGSDAGDSGDAGDAGDAGDDTGDDTGADSAKPAPDPKAEAEKWKALARKHEAQAKANAAAAQQLQALELTGKSETEKLQIMLDEARANARMSTVKALKLSVAAEKGLPPQLAKFLPDLDDEVDMMQAADELLEASGSAVKGDQPTRQPKSKLTSPLGDESASADQRERLINSMLGRPSS